jgi:DNA-binding response OmpR family regulator
MSDANVLTRSIQNPQRILVVDDDGEMRQLIVRKLTSVGYDASSVASGEQALTWLEQHGLPHLAIVDINMPGISGLEFCEIVQQYSDFPVIMVTAVNEATTTIKAIEKYAEDYIVKPFNLNELVVRMQRLLRRIGDFSYVAGPVIKIDTHLSVNFAQKQAFIDGATVELTPTETKLLYILWRNAGRVVTNQFLLGRVWPDQEVFEDALRVHMHRLRQKISTTQGQGQYILTERGQGYRFIAN